MALTATAIPKIQTDIISNLKLRSPYICQQSFDRPNLAIQVLPKDSGGALRAAMEPLIQSLQKQPSSTIIYAPTRNQVEEIASYLQQRLKAEGSAVQTEIYHGTMNSAARHEAHINFLTGKTAVVVATIAFGMGIDKPDTRRVIHYGPPRTVEEYYQQIGRAGRDGLPAECTMYASPSDFDRYLSDFYLKDLNGPAKQASVDSTKSLKAFALNKEVCRRKALLDFFHETPKFGERCGTCDTCRALKKYGEDAARDFGDVARIILEAVVKLKEPGMTNLMKVLGGAVVEDYRYAYGTHPEQLKESLAVKRKALSKKVNQDQLKEFVAALVAKKYIAEETKRMQVGGYDRSWTVYNLSHAGRQALNNTNVKIILSVPESIRQAEKQAEARRQRVLQQLAENGIEVDKLPQKEVEEGDGACIRAFSKWHNYVGSLEKNGKEDLVVQLEELLSLARGWRSNAAIQFRMAPAAVLAEHTMFTVAYAAATLPRGMQVDKDALIAAGARTRDLDSLVEILNDWSQRYRPPSSGGGEAGSHAKDNDPPMVLPIGPTKPPVKWAYAVYKPNKKTGMASWESSYQRFLEGESPQAIAMTPANGRPIQVATVVAHIQDGFLLGREVDLQGLATFSTPPTKEQWIQLEQAEGTMGMDVAGDPTTSGPDGGKFVMTEFLRPIMGDAFTDTPYQERGDEDKEKFGMWCQLLKWHLLLKRAGITPKFEE
jgi:ATP-dependent DNA helicase RecQ/Werner syndrome ATP-dependent helicase